MNYFEAFQILSHFGLPAYRASVEWFSPFGEKLPSRSHREDSIQLEGPDADELR